MIRLTVIGSGSDGNGYVLECGGSRLLLECGVRYMDIARTLGFAWWDVAGCVATHRHGDHYDPETAAKIRSKGIRVYGREGFADGTHGKGGGPWPDPMPLRRWTGIGPWRVMPCPVPHGECPNAALLVAAPDGGKLLLATDLSALPYVFKGVNYLLVEANYDDDTRMRKTLDNETVRSVSRCHMEIGETERVVSAHLSDVLRGVVLLHLSRELSDPMVFKMRISGILKGAGVSAPVWVARRGLRAELSMHPF